jgi:hypothetical protein
MASNYLSNSALKAINRIGDLMIPRNGEFPSFSEVGGIAYIDDLVSYAPPADIKDLNLLLTILAFMPNFVLRWLLNRMENAMESSGPLAPIFRMLDVGLRGLIFSCYYTEKIPASYTGKKPLDIIGFDLTRVED